MRKQLRLRQRWAIFYLCEGALIMLVVSHTALLGTAVGCGGGGASDTLFSSTAIPPDITEDASAGLQGIDANTNGIRDDIDQLIATKYAETPAERKAAEQNARALQRVLSVTTKAEALAASDQSSRAINCLGDTLEGSNEEGKERWIAASEEIQALTANTRERLKRYLEYCKFLGGEILHFPTESTCDGAP